MEEKRKGEKKGKENFDTKERNKTLEKQWENKRRKEQEK